MVASVAGRPLGAGIVHIGVGNFHRAHQAWYLHRLMAAGGHDGWGVCGVGMLPGDAAVRDALVAQGFAYSLLIRHPDGSVDRIEITSLRDYLLASEDPWAVVRALAEPTVRIVTLTITEGGWNTDDTTGCFDAAAPAVLADAVPGAVPTTVFGVLVQALRMRREAGLPPYTILSCDNIEGNGAVARGAVVGFARLLDGELADWIDATVAFPNSMVDRITPVTTDADRSFVLERYGARDAVPVSTEPFAQWVIEDDFPAGRPPLEKVGVQFVNDVRPYELMKLRLLNASHQAMAYAGLLLDHVSVREATLDPQIHELLTRYMAQEGAPTLAPVPGVDLAGYQATLVERFANPEIGDTLTRLAAFASDRIPKWLLPVVRENLSAGRPITLAAGVVATWLHWTETMTAAGRADEVVDNRWAGRDASQLLGDPELFGDLTLSSPFLAAVARTLHVLRAAGVRPALSHLLD